jgi:hypothetical protein
MDTSTVSIVSDILNLCQRYDCKLFLSGMSAELRSVLAHAGVKPLGGERSERKLRFFTTLDAAIGKAEDLLLECQFEEKPPSLRNLFSLGEESGFQFALARVDEQVTFPRWRSFIVWRGHVPPSVMLTVLVASPH